MNLLYITPMIIDFKNLDGVAKKILYQRDAFAKSQKDTVYLASYFSDGKYKVNGGEIEIDIPYSHKSSKILELMEIYPQIPAICEKLHINAVYFRVYALTWVTDRLFNELKKQGIRIAVEIPTYPFWKEKWLDAFNQARKGNIGTACKRSLTNFVYFVFAHRLKRYVSSIVTFSDIEELWGIPVIGIANGYCFDEIPTEESLKTAEEELHLLMVASVRNNHGADRVIRGLSTYLQEKHKRNVVFHIVGDGEAIPDLKNLVVKLNNVEKNVIFHGFLTGDLLEEIYKIGDIGVSAIGFHRLGVYYASPLKSKEYFAKGLPVVGTTVEHDIIKSESKKFYLAFSEDDSDIDILRICNFYDNLSENGFTNRQIASTAAKDFEWGNIMSPVYQLLTERGDQVK